MIKNFRDIKDKFPYALGYAIKVLHETKDITVEYKHYKIDDLTSIGYATFSVISVEDCVSLASINISDNGCITLQKSFSRVEDYVYFNKCLSTEHVTR